MKLEGDQTPASSRGLLLWNWMGKEKKDKPVCLFFLGYNFFQRVPTVLECLSFMVMVYESFGSKNGPIKVHSDETHVTWDVYGARPSAERSGVFLHQRSALRPIFASALHAPALSSTPRFRLQDFVQKTPLQPNFL